MAWHVPISIAAVPTHSHTITRVGATPSSMIEEAFYRLTSRKPDADETALMKNLYDIQLAEFSENPEEAASLIAIGHAPAPDHLPPPQLAAGTVVVNTLMNLHESLTQR